MSGGPSQAGVAQVVETELEAGGTRSNWSFAHAARTTRSTRSLNKKVHPCDPPKCEPGRRIELLSPDYKAGALPLSYPGQLDLCGATDNSMPEAGDRRHGIGRVPH